MIYASPQRPEFCPIHKMSKTQREELPSETASRGIDVGCAVILESGDGKILLTRRATHLRTFPNVWVPPGIITIITILMYVPPGIYHNTNGCVPPLVWV